MTRRELRRRRTSRDEAWWHQATCRGASTSLFFPARERTEEAIDEVGEAKAV